MPIASLLTVAWIRVTSVKSIGEESSQYKEIPRP
jgi:hypothetical protein